MCVHSIYSVENQSKKTARYKQSKPIIEKEFRNSEYDKQIKYLQLKIVENVNKNEHSTSCVEKNDVQADVLKAELTETKNELEKLKAAHAKEVEKMMADKRIDAKKIESLELEITSFKEKYVAEIEVYAAKNLDYANKVKRLELQLKSSKEQHIIEMEEQKRMNTLKSNEIETRLKHFEDEYRGEINSGHVFQRHDKELFCEFIDYANAYLSVPESSKLRAKVVNKMMARVEKYKANSQVLLSRCTFYFF